MNARIEPPIKFDKDNFTMEEYIALQKKSGGGARNTTFADRMNDSVRKYKNYLVGNVLDIGCGEGTAMEAIIAAGHRCEGYELIQSKVDVARSFGLKVTQGYQEKMPFNDNEFDTIFSSHVLEHSYDRDVAVKEYARIAKGAIIIVTIEGNKLSQSHVCGFKDAIEFKQLFKNKGDIITEESLYRMQKEHTIIIDFYET